MHARGLKWAKAASIPKFRPEIKNRCTQEGVNGEILASIRKFGPEIKNRCSSGFATTVCRRNHSLLPQRKLESAAKVFAAMPAVGGTFSFAATRIESAAELVVATTASDGTILLCRKEN